MVAANLGFWGMSLICLALDMFAPSLEKHKVQRGRKFSFREWLHAASVALVNMSVISYCASLCFGWVWRAVQPQRAEEADPFVLSREACCWLGHMVVVDFWFYWTHRALHWPPLYRTVHKIHHKYTSPCAVAAVYAHPLEFVFGNIGGVAMGPILTNCHPYTAYAWFFFTLVSTCGSHSGYRFFSATKHDDHHRLFELNYGVGPLCDTLFGTLRLPKKVKE